MCDLLECLNVDTSKLTFIKGSEYQLSKEYTILIMADHGNADKMRNADGSPNTAHTTALVPCILVQNGPKTTLKPGKLGDIAPTLLHIMGIPKPDAMTGVCLC
jgi:2,3-bisphosphoglycerate-independent phosphoglycerate mutase